MEPYPNSNSLPDLLKTGAFEALVPLINSSLCSVVDPMVSAGAHQDQALERLSQLMKDRVWLNKSPDFKQSLIPDYFLAADWSWIQPGEEFQLSVRLVRLSAAGEFIEATRRMPDPDFLRAPAVGAGWRGWASCSWAGFSCSLLLIYDAQHAEDRGDLDQHHRGPYRGI